MFKAYLEYKAWKLISWIKEGVLIKDIQHTFRSTNFWITFYIYSILLLSIRQYVMQIDSTQYFIGSSFGLVAMLFLKDYWSGEHVNWYKKNKEVKNDAATKDNNRQ